MRVGTSEVLLAKIKETYVKLAMGQAMFMNRK